jgi:hypothetical protein
MCSWGVVLCGVVGGGPEPGTVVFGTAGCGIPGGGVVGGPLGGGDVVAGVEAGGDVVVGVRVVGVVFPTGGAVGATWASAPLAQNGPVTANTPRMSAMEAMAAGWRLGWRAIGAVAA